MEHRADMNTAYSKTAQGTGYRPVVSPQAAERIREWHDAAARQAKRDDSSGQTFVYLGHELVVPPEVHQIRGVDHLLGEAVLAEVRDGDRVLDMGTGSGINAILAASQGAQVVAVDISPEARAAAQHNVERSGLSARIDVQRGDLFTEVIGQFDLIIYEPMVRAPVFDGQPDRDAPAVEMRGVASFVRDARQYLTARGRMLFFVGPSPELPILMELAADENFTTHLVAQEALINAGLSVDYFAFRLTPADPVVEIEGRRARY
jgi:release factor glutamine methyltransferase